MGKVLYITANPKPVSDSYSLTVGKEFLDSYKRENPGDEIVELDLYQREIPLIDRDIFSAWSSLEEGGFSDLTEIEQQKLTKMNDLLEEFIAVDKYIFVTPLWNFSLPPMMRAYIDNICVAGKTFEYTDDGPKGLMTDKQAVHIHSRGGIYSEDIIKDFDFANRYLQRIFSFLDIELVDSLIIEGTNQLDEEEATEMKNKAIEKAKGLAQKLARR
ncbi:FMN-dependent NADH-azoreductase AzoRB [Halanaerocella petrolearia]